MTDIYTSDRLILTGVREGDRAVMARWQEDSDYARYGDTDIAYPGRSQEFPSGSFEFMIRLRETGELIGYVTIHSVEWGSGSGTLSIGIGREEHRSHGYGRETMLLILRFAFNELNLHRVSLDVIEYNDRAIKLYQSLGFVTEGRAREYVYRDGRRYDLLRMGILRREWENRM